jgi:hypothetical protein
MPSPSVLSIADPTEVVSVAADILTRRFPAAASNRASNGRTIIDAESFPHIMDAIVDYLDEPQTALPLRNVCMRWNSKILSSCFSHLRIKVVNVNHVLAQTAPLGANKQALEWQVGTVHDLGNLLPIAASVRSLDIDLRLWPYLNGPCFCAMPLQAVRLLWCPEGSGLLPETSGSFMFTDRPTLSSLNPTTVTEGPTIHFAGTFLCIKDVLHPPPSRAYILLPTLNSLWFTRNVRGILAAYDMSAVAEMGVPITFVGAELLTGWVATTLSPTVGPDGVHTAILQEWRDALRDTPQLTGLPDPEFITVVEYKSRAGADSVQRT